MEASYPSDASFHTLSLINKQIMLPVAPGRYFNEINQEWASPMFKWFLSKQMHYESLIHYITNDSKPIALNFNLSQVSSDKLRAVSHSASPRSKFSKGKCFGRWVLQWHPPPAASLSFSYRHLNFKWPKLKQYDLAGDRFLPLGGLIWKEEAKIITKCPMPTSWNRWSQRAMNKILPDSFFTPHIFLGVLESGIFS